MVNLGTVGVAHPDRRLTVIVWITEGTWPATIEAVRAHELDGADLLLLLVTPAEVPGAAHGAFAGLLGRGRPERCPGTRVEQLAAASAGTRSLPKLRSGWADRVPASSAHSASCGKSLGRRGGRPARPDL